mgnify:CR=1 FL=1
MVYPIGAELVKKHVEVGKLVHGGAEKSFEWTLFVAMAHHWYGVGKQVGKNVYTNGFMRMVHRGVQDWVPAEFKRGYD